MDGDGDLDAFVLNRNAPNQVWLNDGSGTFSDSGQRLAGFRSAAVTLGDVDGDGDLDAVVSNYFGGTKVWLNDGSGEFSDSGQSLGNSFGQVAALGDLDGDGDLDALTGNTVWLNDGNGIFAAGHRLDFGDVALGDLDGDGDLDVLAGGFSLPSTVWLNDGTGRFTDSGQKLGKASIPRVALGDLDGDGDLDALTDDNVWLNDGKGTFTGTGHRLVGNAVALGDLDGDGDLDAFVGNGLRNTGEPNTVWLNQDALPADFDNDSDVDGDDFLAWQAGFGIQMGATLADGDADGDVDGDDFLIWQSSFGAAAGAQGSGATAPDHPAHLKPRADGGDLTQSSRRIHVAAVDRSLSDDVLLDHTHKAKLKASILADDLVNELARSRAAKKDAIGA